MTLAACSCSLKRLNNHGREERWYSPGRFNFSDQWPILQPQQTWTALADRPALVSHFLAAQVAALIQHFDSADKNPMAATNSLVAHTHTYLYTFTHTRTHTSNWIRRPLNLLSLKISVKFVRSVTNVEGLTMVWTSHEVDDTGTGGTGHVLHQTSGASDGVRPMRLSAADCRHSRLLPSVSSVSTAGRVPTRAALFAFFFSLFACLPCHSFFSLQLTTLVYAYN